MPRIERPRRRTAFISTRSLTEGYGPSRTGFRTRNPNKSSLYDVMQNRRRAEACRKSFFSTSDVSSSRHRLVEPDGIEPTTSCLQSRRSNQLSYKPLQAYLVGKRHRDKVSQGRQFPEQDWPSRLVPRPRKAPPK